MTRKHTKSGRALAAASIGVIAIGGLALILLQGYLVSRVLVLAAMAVALGGLALRWRKHLHHRRRRESNRMQI